MDGIEDIYDIMIFSLPCVMELSILVDAPSKAWVCGRSLAGIAGSNPAGGMEVCLLGA